MTDSTNHHIRDGETDYSLCSRKWKHVGANNPNDPLCFHCQKERDRRARRSGIARCGCDLSSPAARELGCAGHKRAYDAALSVAEKLPAPPPRLPTYEEFLAGQFGSPWTVALGNLWAAYSERQARERGTR